MGDDELLQWEWRWLGRIVVVRIPGGLVYIGPHWYCCFVMLAFILGVGLFFLSSGSVQRDTLQILGGVVATALSTITFLRCAISNPGVVRPKPDQVLVEGLESAEAPRRDRHCFKCNIEQPRGCSHCDFCAVCI